MKIFACVTHRGLCQECSNEAAKAVKEFPLLKDEIQLLRAENTSFKEELTELRALLTSTHLGLTTLETRVTLVADTVDLLQATPSPTASQTESGVSVGGGVRSYASVCSSSGTGVAGRGQRQQGPENSNKSSGTGQQSRGRRSDRGRESARGSGGNQSKRQHPSTETSRDAGGEKVSVVGKEEFGAL